MRDDSGCVWLHGDVAAASGLIEAIEWVGRVGEGHVVA